MAQFDALAPYHPTSEGILAKLLKRPYHERSMENKNVAAIYAGGKLLMKLVPSQASTVRQMFWKLRLDPDDNEVSQNLKLVNVNIGKKSLFQKTLEGF